jgi:SAM-dependent methyltransferase
MGSHLVSEIPVRLETAPCPMGCAHAKDEFLLVGRDRLHKLPGEFTVVQCSVCGLLRTNPRPNLGTIGYFYPRDYAPYHKPAGEKLTLRDHIAARAHRLLNAWRIPNLPPGRLLEFGCGPGGYLLWMAHQGWSVVGIETSEEAAQTARSLGLLVHVGPLETAPDPEAPYDLSVGWMVVEHLHDPVKALRNVAAWTRDAGWLAISVPNADSREFSFFGDSWFALELPRHLYHFTPQTITLLLEKAGWQVRRIYQQRSIDNIIASCGYLLENISKSRVARSLSRQLVRFPTNVPLHFLTYPLLFPVACILAMFGQTGRMTVLAQKSE